ncbi:MAG TPA: hypothetical protein VH682_24825 [Gemmataceae bacterium]
MALALGSSRIAFGLQPASVMKQLQANAAAQPILFNFAMLGVGPVGERLVLHRLVSMGLKPKWAFIEVWAPFLPQAGFSDEESILFRRDLFWSDLPTIGRLYRRRGEAAGQVFAETVAPLLHYRLAVLDHCVPFLMPPALLSAVESTNRVCSRLDGSGWVPLDLDRADPAAQGNQILRAHLMTKPRFDEFCINAVSDKAIRETLEECRAQDIRVVLLIMPEHSLLRGWYPLIETRLTAYLQRLSEEYHAPVIDARAWQGDEDIPDYCHLSPRGARAFSARFGREVYLPLLQNRPLAKDLLLCGPSTP